MRFGQYVKEEEAMAQDDSEKKPGMDGAVPVSTDHIDADDESSEEGGDKFDGFANIQSVVHILSEIDHMDDTNDVKVRLNELLQTVAEDLEDLLASIEKDEDEDEGESEESEEDESEEDEDESSETEDEDDDSESDSDEDE